MLGSDGNEVAAMHGVRNGTLLWRWMRNLNYLRNVCAHHSRLWNRTMTYSFSKWQSREGGETVSHVSGIEPQNRPTSRWRSPRHSSET